MTQHVETNAQRVNITVPAATLTLMNQIAGKGGRSAFIDRAVNFYVRHQGKKRLKKMLTEGAARRAARDLQITKEWFTVDEL